MDTVQLEKLDFWIRESDWLTFGLVMASFFSAVGKLLSQDLWTRYMLYICALLCKLKYVVNLL